MILTFTHEFENIANQRPKKAINISENAEPSKSTIDRILNFSKNLEVKPSKFLSSVEFLKS